jgi:hypothetical protein
MLKSAKNEDLIELIYRLEGIDHIADLMALLTIE